MLKGIAASDGYGIGRAVVIKNADLDYSSSEFTDAESEMSRLDKAVDDFIAETEMLSENIKNSVGESESDILRGHIAMLNDPFMRDRMTENIKSGIAAEKAVDMTCRMFIDAFSAADDELTRQRVSDIRDIRNSLLQRLLGVNNPDISTVPPDSILVAHDFTPSMTGKINRNNVCAIITETGGITSHSAILARAMGIPAVLSADNASDIIKNGDMLICDGFSGEIILNANDSDIEKYRRLRYDFFAKKELLKVYINKKTATADGEKKSVCANIGRAEEIESVIENGGDGIGLFRTEFLFMDRAVQPSEEEQLKTYAAAAKAMNGKEVIIRTLDIGGDKNIPYLLTEKEDNPFLGFRGIRYCLDNKEIFKTQIRAVLQAAVYGNIKIMLPIITSVDEVCKAKELIKECENELCSENKDYRSVPLGIMIETPAAALISDILAAEADFFSIGTNDLTGYVMAADRGNPKVSKLCDFFHPAVLRAIEMTVKNAKRAGIRVGMCGEAAADERLISHLLDWGIDELSVTPRSILQTRKAICEYKA